MGRRRLRKNRDLPDNLYPNGKYFTYINPENGEAYSFGSDRAAAIRDARKLNAVLEPKVKTDRVAKVLNDTAGSMTHVARRYLAEYIPTKGLAGRTVSDVTYRIERIIRDIGGWPMGIVTVKVVADYLDTLPPNTYEKMRNELIYVFQFAISKGIIPPHFNPAKETLKRKPGKRKQQPLHLEDYHQIYALAPHWLQVALDMMFVTLQRPVDLVNMKYADIRDGILYVQQQKVERHDNWQSNLAIPVKGRLAEVVTRSRQDGVASPYIIHKMPERKIKNRKGCDHWTQLQGNYIGRQFAKIRNTLPQFQAMEPEERPPWYAVKSLGGWVYMEHYGWSEEQVQALMGHTDAKTTRVYTDRHIEWSQVGME